MRVMPLQAAAARMTDLRAVLALRDFRTYQIGNVVSTVGFWMQRVAIGWVTWELTGSEAWLGLVAFAELFPSILTGLVGGALADRGSRVRLMMWGHVGVVAVSAVLWTAQMGGWLTAPLILVLMAMLGALSGLVLPARLAMASVLAPPALLPSALAVNATSFNLSRFVGPALAGLILVLGGPAPVFALTMAGYLVFVACLYRIADAEGMAREAPPTAGEPRGARRSAPPSSWRVLRDLAGAPLIVGVLLVQLLQGLTLRPAAELFPAFAEDVFGRGAAGVGLLNAALGLGAVAGALLLARARDTASSLRTIVVGTLVFAGTLAVFAGLDLFWAALLVLVVQGAAMSSSNIAAMAFVQLETPKERLGRVLSVYALVFRAGPAVGAVAFGLFAEIAGLQTAALIAAIAGALATGAVALWMTKRKVRHA